MRSLINRYIVFLAFIFYSSWAYGQQDPMFTQYMNNPMLINPAYAGYNGNMNISGIFRKQWFGLDGSPLTSSISANTPWRNYKVGLGASFFNDIIGPLNQSGIYFSYSYKLEFEKGSTLAMGLMAGINYYQKDLTGLITYEEDPWVKQNPTTTKTKFNTGIGLFYYTPSYYVSFSIPKLLRNSLNKNEDLNLENIVTSKEELHYFLFGGYLFAVNPILKIRPSALFRYVYGTPFSTEISGTAIFYDLLWGGLTYRVGDALAAHVRYQMSPQIQLGYSYDFNNSNLKSSNMGTHEIFLSYTFTRKGEKIQSPRYFQ